MEEYKETFRLSPGFVPGFRPRVSRESYGGLAKGAR